MCRKIKRSPWLSMLKIELHPHNPMEKSSTVTRKPITYYLLLITYYLHLTMALKSENEVFTHP